MKNYMFLLITSLCFLSMAGYSAITKEKQEDDGGGQTPLADTFSSYLDGVNADDIQEVAGIADYAIDKSDVNQLRDSCNNVFIGTVNRIEGAHMKTSTGEFSDIPETYGRITVLQNLKGKTKEKQIKFIKTGGTLLTKQLHNEYAAQYGYVVKNDENDYPTYTRVFFEGDIALEAGKTYVFFANLDVSSETYRIVGSAFDAREIVQSSTKQSIFKTLPETSSLLIKNNENSQYEPLDLFLKKYFKS